MQPNYQLLIYKRIGQRIAIFGIILVSCFGTFGILGFLASFPIFTIVMAALGLVFGLAVMFYGISIFNNATVTLTGTEIIVRGIRKRVTIPYSQIFDIDIGSIEKLFPNGKLPAADVAWLGDFYNLNGLMIQLRPTAGEEINLQDLHHLIYNEKRNECLFLVKDWIEMSKLVKEHLSLSEEVPQKSASERFREMVTQASEYPFESVVTSQARVYVLGSNRKVALQVKTMLTSIAQVDVIAQFETGLDRIKHEQPDLIYLVDNSFKDESLSQLMQIRQAKAQVPILYVVPELDDEDAEQLKVVQQVDTLSMPLDRDVLVSKTNDWVNWRKRQAGNFKGVASIVEIVQGREETMPVDITKLEQIQAEQAKEAESPVEINEDKVDEFEAMMAEADSTPRIVTILTLTFKEATKLQATMSPADYKRFMDKFQNEVEKIISAQFGQIEDRGEISLILSFGVSRELDPARQGLFSLNTAFGIQKLLERMTESLDPDVQALMAPSIGIFAAKARIQTDFSNGQTKVVTGAPRQLSSVLSRRANPNQILCGRNTIKPVYKRFEFRSIGNLMLDKEDIEIPVFEIVRRIKPEERARVIA